MNHLVEGGCLCGAIRFSLRARPLTARACWCRVCQKLSSGNASVNAYFRSETLEIDGAPASFTRRAESGAVIRHRFCAACGTQLFADQPDEPGFVAVRAGALDDPALARPEVTLWTSSAPDWGLVDPGIPRHRRHLALEGR